MKRLLLVFLILSSNLFAEQGETILNHPQDSDCGDDFAFFAQEDIEREIAEFEAKLAALLAEEAVEKEISEFEAKLAKVLADKAAQEIMAEIEAECEAKAKLPKLKPTVCEPNRGGYEAYVLGIKN